MTIENALETATKLSISIEQVAYMHYQQHNMPFPLEMAPSDIGEMKLRGYLTKSGITDAWKREMGEVVDRPISVTIDPILAPVLAKLSTVLIRHSPSKHTESKIKEAFHNNEGLGKLYYTWLCLFPAQKGTKEIEGWEALFNVSYTNVRLRKFTSSSARNFKTLARRKDFDMGLYVLGTMLFIESRINNGQTFIPTMEKFIAEQVDWYETAEGYFVDDGVGVFNKRIETSCTVNVNEEMIPVYTKLFKFIGTHLYSSSLVESVKLNMNDDPQVEAAFHTWFGLFPSSDKSMNTGWEQLFGIEFEKIGVRTLTPKIISHFKTLLQIPHFNFGYYLIGTYLYVKSRISEGEIFISTIDKYFEVEMDWYSKGEKMTKDKSTAEILRLLQHDASTHKSIEGVGRAEGATLI